MSSEFPRRHREISIPTPLRGYEEMGGLLTRLTGVLVGPEQHISLGRRIHSEAQILVIVIIERNKPKCLDDRLCRNLSRVQHLGHAVHRAILSLERHFDKITFLECSRHVQKAAGQRNSLQPGFCAVAVIQLYKRKNGLAKLNARGTVLRIGLGEMGHGPIFRDTPPL